MLPLIKALIGLAGAGVGAMVPVAVNNIGGSKIKEDVAKVVNSLSSSNSVERVRREVSENKENKNFLDSFAYLNSRNCNLIQNPAGSKSQFHAFYACKGESGKASFYYLGSRDTTKVDGVNAIREVETVNYEKLDKGVAQLSLKFKDSSNEIRLNLVEQGEGGWSHFKNVNLSEKCRIETKKLGGDDLRCELTDSNNKSFFYNFSVF